MAKAPRTVQLADDEYDRMRTIAQGLGCVTARENQVIGLINRLPAAFATGEVEVQKAGAGQVAGVGDKLKGWGYGDVGTAARQAPRPPAVAARDAQGREVAGDRGVLRRD